MFVHDQGYSSGSAGGALVPAPPASLLQAPPPPPEEPVPPRQPTQAIPPLQPVQAIASAQPVQAIPPAQPVQAIPPAQPVQAIPLAQPVQAIPPAQPAQAIFPDQPSASIVPKVQLSSPSKSEDAQLKESMELFEVRLAQAKRKRLAELEEEEEEWLAKRRASRAMWEERCARDDLARERRHELEYQAHVQKMNSDLQAHKLALQAERDEHEARLATLLEQVSSMNAQVEAGRPAMPSSQHQVSQDVMDLKARLKQKTDLCRSSITTTPPASSQAPSPASTQEVTPPPTSLAPNPSHLQLAQPPMVAQPPVVSQPPAVSQPPVVAVATFNSSTHPQAWGALYRITRNSDCADDIKKAWNAGASSEIPSLPGFLENMCVRYTIPANPCIRHCTIGSFVFAHP